MGTTAGGVNGLVEEEEKFRFCLTKLGLSIGQLNGDLELVDKSDEEKFKNLEQEL